MSMAFLRAYSTEAQQQTLAIEAVAKSPERSAKDLPQMSGSGRSHPMPRSWSPVAAAGDGPLDLPADGQLGRVQVDLIPAEPKDLALARPEHEDDHLPGA
jgi:hypothetical protein